MRASVLLALLALLAAPRGSNSQNLITQVLGKVWDVVFRSFAEASGYKVTALPPKKKAEEKSAAPVVHHKSFQSSTTERIQIHTETFTSSSDETSAPQPPFSFYSSEEPSFPWPKKDEDDEGIAEESSKRIKKPVKISKRIKSQRSGLEEKVSFRHVDTQTPGGAPKEPLVIKLLSATPTKDPSLDDSWPSVWRGAH
ncbi:uncharacterized protein LOC132196809 [Neocloeon triangulifer]|uniref:uncharacterized protein LOC132196809 n=1 Tax=Neocloeon triangulifer TaxID=2078957 RepID=UPI00286ED562|nr:uncharacterized protein LOC132196809 [Neocloeon triangulifer]